ncbi:hypothetical protein ACP275_01G119800 [Erythranthe tilingii]
MAFWAIQVKRGNPKTHYSWLERDAKGRDLQIKLATLVSDGSNNNNNNSRRSYVECQVGSNSAVTICSLVPNKLESCPLNLMFSKNEVVEFSVIGPSAVNLIGHYLDHSSSSSSKTDVGEDGLKSDSSEKYGEDSNCMGENSIGDSVLLATQSWNSENFTDKKKKKKKDDVDSNEAGYMFSIFGK